LKKQKYDNEDQDIECLIFSFGTLKISSEEIVDEMDDAKIQIIEVRLLENNFESIILMVNLNN
jgi:hypothetical protein